MIRIVSLALLASITMASPLGAADLTIGDFLASAKRDGALDQQDEKLAFLHSASPNTPYVDRLEFRTATDEFRATNQSYRLRLYPAGWGETTAGQQLFDTTLEFTEAQREMVLHQALKKRYELIIEYIYTTDALALHRKLLLLHKDRITVLKSSTDSMGFDINDLLEAEDDVLRLQMDLPELENELGSIEYDIRQCAGSQAPISFDPSKIAEIAHIKQAIEQIDCAAAGEEDNIYLRRGRLRLEQDRCRYDLERSQSRRFISFIETSYDNAKREHAREAYSIELGIELPFVNSERLDINRRKLDYLTEKGRYEETKQAVDREVERLKGELARLFEHHGLVSESMKAESYRQAEGADPLVLLKIQESILRKDCALNELNLEIYRRYVDLLDLSGYLSRKPVRNYLSAKQEEITL